MKKGLFLALALSLTGALACYGKNIQYEVKGSNAPKDGAKVYLVDQATMAPIDSTVVARGLHGQELADKISEIIL